MLKSYYICCETRQKNTMRHKKIITNADIMGVAAILRHERMYYKTSLKYEAYIMHEYLDGIGVRVEYMVCPGPPPEPRDEKPNSSSASGVVAV